ncbi:VOC family protein [Myxacorys almedinensis]|uniref:VOC family protein n=1 Tax=Myxacorys almedinensis A TaxID=2690445 RepID=A0A8J7Z0F6_9CYAN|nr:VOC family protein [Myxacorys almedinensis]NDJ17967.1 VOC family protein [Myxacorys almedinensis A]
MHLNPYLFFNGQCESAFKFYEKCLGGKITAMMTYGESPMAEQTPPEWRNKILHAHLMLGDQELMGADAPPEMFEAAQGFYVSLHFTNPSEAEHIFNALEENGTIRMALQETFWASRFAMLVDQFGTPWMINCDPREGE